MASDLSTLIQNLPQELYDEIYTLIITPSATEHVIRGDYRPPCQLQVSRSSRRQFAELYYGGNSRFFVSKHWATQFLCSVESEHLDSIRDVRILGTGMLSTRLSPMAQGRRQLILLDLFRKDGVVRDFLGKALLANNVLKFRVVFSRRKEKWASFEELLAGISDEL